MKNDTASGNEGVRKMIKCDCCYENDGDSLAFIIEVYFRYYEVIDWRISQNVHGIYSLFIVYKIKEVKDDE